MPTFLVAGKKMDLLTILVLAMLKSKYGCHPESKLVNIYDLSGYIFNIMGEETNG